LKIYAPLNQVISDKYLASARECPCINICMESCCVDFRQNLFAVSGEVVEARQREKK
jgi:hypothetical protein